MANESNALILRDGVGEGERVRLARTASRLSRKEVARALGLSLRTYDRVEAGERELTLHEATVLARLTEQEISFFGASSDEHEGGGDQTLPLPLPTVKGKPQA